MASPIVQPFSECNSVQASPEEHFELERSRSPVVPTTEKIDSRARQYCPTSPKPIEAAVLRTLAAAVVGTVSERLSQLCAHQPPPGFFETNGSWR